VPSTPPLRAPAWSRESPEHSAQPSAPDRPARCPRSGSAHHIARSSAPTCPHNPSRAHARASPSPEPSAGSSSAKARGPLRGPDRKAQRQIPGPSDRRGWTGGGGFPPGGRMGTQSASGSPGKQKVPTFQAGPRNSGALSGAWGSGGRKKLRVQFPTRFLSIG
jgi:hypothetical protein